MSHLEAVKWLAFGAMLLDHVDLALFGRQVEWMHQAGRFAFPVFAVCFGLGLAKTSDPLRVVARLAVPAVLSEVAWLMLPTTVVLHCLTVFAACGLAVAAHRRSAWLGLASWLTVLGVSIALRVEAGWGGVLLVACAYLAGRQGVVWPHLVGAAPWLLFAASPGLLAGLAAPHLARLVPVVVPRVPGLLAWGYPLHLLALVVLRIYPSNA